VWSGQVCGSPISRLLLKTPLRLRQVCDKLFSVLVCIKLTSLPILTRPLQPSSGELDDLLKSGLCGEKTGQWVRPTTSTWYSWATISVNACMQEMTLMLEIASTQKKRKSVALYIFCCRKAPPETRFEALATHCGWKLMAGGDRAVRAKSGEQPRYLNCDPPPRLRHPRLHSDAPISLEYEFRDKKAPLLQSALVSRHGPCSVIGLIFAMRQLHASPRQPLAGVRLSRQASVLELNSGM
jgi:hypothetical protein